MAGEITTTVIGNLVADPELRFTPNGVAVARFTVAHTPRTKDAASGEWRDGEPTYLDCTVWRQAAENVTESLTKGARVIVHGRLKTERWEKEGEKRSRLVMDVDGVGPELTWATATVRKATRRAGETAPDDPWATASSTRPAASATGGFGSEEPPF